MAKRRTRAVPKPQGRRGRALLYLRVSTRGQVDTDYDPEGISIPAQRQAGQRKATELDADVVDEYVEPGRSATEVDHRPAFQEMVARVKAQRDADYIIVYNFNRIFRNSIDAAITKQDLAEHGVRVVSTVIDLGVTPEAAMVESIMHAVDQYYSDASGADIAYKMGQKAKSGGTITRAPLGYGNVIVHLDGKKIRDVEPDPKRAPLITQAFELYATGHHNARQVLDTVTAAGLRTRATKRSAEKPLSLNRLYQILSDPYYAGVIEYQGEEFPGRHQPLISRELFDRVQEVLTQHGGGGTRQRKHHHYLKGLVWCDDCRQRFVIMPGRGNGGTYWYFVCVGRVRGTCDQPYIPAAELEKKVASHYATVRISHELQAELRQYLAEAELTEANSLTALRRHLKQRLSELDVAEDRHLDLLGSADMPEDKIRDRLRAITAERKRIKEQLADAGSKLALARRFITVALDLLSDPQAFYEQADGPLRQSMNQVVFTRLWVSQGEIEHHDLTATVEPLIQADQARQQQASAGAAPPHPRGPRLTAGANPLNHKSAAAAATTLKVQGSNNLVLVGDTGIEPVTSSVSGKRSPAELIARDPAEVETGFEPVYTALQAVASPLGHSTEVAAPLAASERTTGLEPATLTLAR